MFGGHFKFYHVYDKNGNVIVSKETEAEAIDFLEKLKRKDGVQTTPSPNRQRGPNGRFVPNLGQVAPDPSLAGSGATGAAHPYAFKVVEVGGGRFATFDETGRGNKDVFPSRELAEQFAESQRRAFAARQQAAALQSIASSRPPASPLPAGAARPSIGTAATRAMMGWMPRPTPSSALPNRPSRLDPTPIDLADIPTGSGTGVTPGGPTGLGAAGPKLGQLASALGKAADALSGVVNASQGIPLSSAPSKPAQAGPPPSFARRAIDSLGAAMTPVFGKQGEVKGMADAFKGFREAFARGFGPAPIYPTRAPVGGIPQPGGYPANRAASQPPPAATRGWFANWPRKSPEPADADTYGLGVPGSGNVQPHPGFFHSVGASIANQFQQAMSAARGFSPSGAWQTTRGFASNFGHAFQNPAGGIPFGAGGWAGSAARQAVTGIGQFGQASGSAAGRAGAGVQAAFQVARAGGGTVQMIEAFGAAAGLGGPVTAAIAGVAAVGIAVGVAAKEFFELTQRMRAFADSVVEGNRSLARYNGSIASAYIGLAMHDFHRDLRFGRETQGTAISAVRAVDAMRDDWMGVDILQGNVSNRLAGMGAAFSGSVGSALSGPASAINAKLEEVDPNGWVSAGAVAGLGAGIKGFAQGYYDSFMNDPLGSFLIPGLAGWRALGAGQAAAAKAADAAVTDMAGAIKEGFHYNELLNTWARGGVPLTRRPSPRP
jgi:hypothetical protein